MSELTHLDAEGHAHMVDIGEKSVTRREAVARGMVLMRPETLRQIVAGGVPKGDVLAVARVAGIMAAKRAPDLIPLCHPLLLTHVALDLPPAPHGAGGLVQAAVRTTGQTGGEVEARPRGRRGA